MAAGKVLVLLEVVFTYDMHKSVQIFPFSSLINHIRDVSNRNGCVSVTLLRGPTMHVM